MREELETLREVFLLYRKELGYGLVACIVAALRHWQRRDPFREIVVNGMLCGIVAFGINDLLTVFDMASTSRYLSSVLLGYIGVETILGSLPFNIPLTRKTKRRNDDV